MLVFHCQCLTIVPHTLELKFLSFMLLDITLCVHAGYLQANNAVAQNRPLSGRRPGAGDAAEVTAALH